MTQLFEIHALHPQRRLVTQAVARLRAGGLIVYPTDSTYAFGFCLGNKQAMERVRAIRRLGPDHHFTLVCRDLSELATYARVDNQAFRLLKSLTPGPYTFILPATREVPRRLAHPKRKSIGIRVPDNPVARALLETLGEPMMSASLLLPDETLPLADPREMAERLAGRVDLIVDGGFGGLEPSTVVDLTEAPPKVLRRGLGDPDAIGGDRV